MSCYDISMNLLRRDFVVREPVLVGILVLITIVFSALTHSYSAAYDRKREALSKEWFERGSQALTNHQADQAVEDFRTALLYAPQRWDYRLRLAEALTATGRTRQARDYYLSLWPSKPTNGPVNLALARLSAEAGEIPEAERYYNGAIFGDWPADAPDHRRDALFELIDFYLKRGDTGQAESQLMILSSNLPEDASLRLRVADLFARVGDDQRASREYRQANQLNPANPAGILGAGQAAYRMGNFHEAEVYLSQAHAVNPSDEKTMKLLDTTRAILELNPSEAGISAAERARRALAIYETVNERLDSCKKSPDPSANALAASLEGPWRIWKPNANQRHLEEHPDQINALVRSAASMESQIPASCGPPSDKDSAILLIGRQTDNNGK